MSGYALGGSGGGSNPSDPAGINITPGGPVSLPASPALVASDPFKVRGYRWIDVALAISNSGVGPITRVDWQFQWANTLLAPSASDWNIVFSELITAGIAPSSNYTPQTDITGFVAPFSIGERCRVMGTWMRVLWSAGAGNPAGNQATATAERS